MNRALRVLGISLLVLLAACNTFRGGPSDCERCAKPGRANHVCGVTTLCPRCEKDAGPGHACELTEFCKPCGRELPKDHICPGRR